MGELFHDGAGDLDSSLLRQPAELRRRVIVEELLRLRVRSHGKLFESLLRAYLSAGRRVPLMRCKFGHSHPPAEVVAATLIRPSHGVPVPITAPDCAHANNPPFAGAFAPAAPGAASAAPSAVVFASFLGSSLMPRLVSGSASVVGLRGKAR